MNAFIEDIKRIPILLLGFIILSLGLMLTIRANIGNTSWSVFHQGVSMQTGLSFGIVTQLFGVIFLIISIVFLKTKIGIGTILNVAIIGFIIDGSDLAYTFIPTTVIEKSLMFTVGILFTTFGRAMYISARLGAGPRDGIFVGLSRVTKIDVKYVKPGIELIVLVIGFFLGGVVGIGTLISMIISGYLVQFFFKLLQFDPKTEKQSNLLVYFKQNEKFFQK
ncbi:MAG: membrane protein [Bacilli bacterium]|nr:membrane protein [Bacilli bacterium]